MNKTDSPLKRLVQLAPIDFAEWLLDRKVMAVTTANIELQSNPNPLYTDLVFWVRWLLLRKIWMRITPIVR